MILAIVGPTGVGKTKLSIELAKKYNGIIINCDAMQVYQGLDIGTAKIKEEEKEGIPHYLFDIVDVNTNYTVFDYQKDVREILKNNPDKTIIFVGGTGLYLKSALYDYRFSPKETKFDDTGYTNEELLALCLKKDANCNIHVNNRKRLIRFLEREEEVTDSKPLYNCLYIGLTTNRDKLYSIIDNRVLKMLENGLEQEVRKFYDSKVNSKALQTGIGYKEFYSYFDGSISYQECIELIQKNSRHYAKRQYTFFNHQLPVKWFDVNYDNFNETILEVEKYITKEAYKN